MNKLTKFGLLSIFSLFFFYSAAQKYSIEAGYIQQKRYGEQFKTTYFNGVRLGGNVEFGLKHNFSLLTGALYSFVYSRNAQYYSPSDSVVYKTFNHALEIPLQVQYKLPVSKNFKFFAYAGPNIAIGLAQPQKVTAVLSSDMKTYMDKTIPQNQIPFMRTTSVGYAENDLYAKAVINNINYQSIINRINLQMSVGGGMQYKNYKLKGGYEFGINSINKVDTSNMLRQNGWFVSLIYQF